MFKISDIKYAEGGRAILYDYQTDAAIAKYFSSKEAFYIKYDVDVSGNPDSINIIPLLANVMPIAWFAGFDVYVDVLDEKFYHSLEELRREFAVHFPQIKTNAKLHVNQLEKNTISGLHTALLFSGGLDAFESLTRNIDKKPFLVSVLGADIEIKDKKRWADFQRFNAEEPVINDDRICYVESNLRTFYTYEVDLLVDIGWWGKIQHGMALITLIAPLSWLKKIGTVLIASSNTGEISFGWGSTSETDEKVRWADIAVIHDGFHLRRTEKIQNIVDFAKKTGEHIKLRVCYSELRDGYNCSQCAKCQRTMFGLILSGENPAQYGFELPSDFYELIFRNFKQGAVMTQGVAYEWQCLQEKAAHAAHPFIIKDAKAEKNNFDTFVSLDLASIINQNEGNKFAFKKLKFIVISNFPRLFKLYMNVRRKF